MGFGLGDEHHLFGHAFYDDCVNFDIRDAQEDLVKGQTNPML